MLWNQLLREEEGKLAESLHLNQLLDDMFSLFVCSVYIIGCSIYFICVFLYLVHVLFSMVFLNSNTPPPPVETSFKLMGLPAYLPTYLPSLGP